MIHLWAHLAVTTGVFVFSHNYFLLKGLSGSQGNVDRTGSPGKHEQCQRQRRYDDVVKRYVERISSPDFLKGMSCCGTSMQTCLVLGWGSPGTRSLYVHLPSCGIYTGACNILKTVFKGQSKPFSIYTECHTTHIRSIWVIFKKSVKGFRLIHMYNQKDTLGLIVSSSWAEAGHRTSRYIVKYQQCKS